MLAFRPSGSTSHLNTRFQSKPPLRSADAEMYRKSSILITSITGETTVSGFCKMEEREMINHQHHCVTARDAGMIMSI